MTYPSTQNFPTVIKSIPSSSISSDTMNLRVELLINLTQIQKTLYSATIIGGRRWLLDIYSHKVLNRSGSAKTKPHRS